MGRYKSYLTGVQNEGGGSRPLLDNVQKKDAFFWGVFPKYFCYFKDILKRHNTNYIKEWLVIKVRKYLLMTVNPTVV